MEDRQPRWQKNDPILHEQLNQHSEGIERTNSRQAEENGELRVADTPPAQILDVVGKGEPFWAVLSGATSPYSWTKVVLDSAGAWQTTTRTGTTNAYEVNARTGLNGKYARLYPDRINGYRFYAKQCCSTGCGSGTRTIHVNGCNLNYQGATVSITGPGGFTASGTTNASGDYTFGYTGYPAGTYSYSVSATRYSTATGTITLACGGSGTTTVAMSAASGYRCVQCCPNPLLETLSFTTPYGTSITLTYTAGKWIGTSVETLTCAAPGVAPATGTVTLDWEMDTFCVPQASVFHCNLDPACDPYIITDFPFGQCNFLISGDGPNAGAEISKTCSPFVKVNEYLLGAHSSAPYANGTVSE